jgi:tetratricopeptide (TPR) repeat protein
MNWILIILVILGIVVFVKKVYSFENLQSMGIKRYREGNFFKAISYLEKADKKNPNHPETILALGESHLQNSIYLQNSIKEEPISTILSKTAQGQAVLNFKKYLKLEPNGYHRKQIIQKMKSIHVVTTDKNLSVEIENFFSELNESLNQ